MLRLFTSSFVLIALPLASAAVNHEYGDCYGKCLNPHHENSGVCTSGFCGDGACCELGVFGRPPCDGRTMGCNGKRCCVAPEPVAGGAGAHAASFGSRGSGPPPSPPPLPPLSECAIARVTYEIGRMRRDAYGDKIFEVQLQVEPWRTGSIIKLVYHQTDVEGGNERPIEAFNMVGASTIGDTREAYGTEGASKLIEQRTILMKLGNGSDASLKPCRFADVQVTASSSVLLMIGSPDACDEYGQASVVPADLLAPNRTWCPTYPMYVNTGNPKVGECLRTLCDPSVIRPRRTAVPMAMPRMRPMRHGAAHADRQSRVGR